MNAIDLFCGAGGMSYGARLAGFTPLVAVDSAPQAVLTYKSNFPNVTVLQRDIRTLQPDQLTVPPSRPFAIFGGPPCQGFSTSNQKTRLKTNKRNWLFQDFLRFVHALEPDWVVFENVKGVIETAGGYFFRKVQRELRACDYTVTPIILNANLYGVPQSRSRVFIVASRKRRTFATPAQLGNTLTVRDAIFDLPILRNGACEDKKMYRLPPHSQYAELMRGNLESCTGHLVTRNADHIIERYKFIPSGGNWKDIPKIHMNTYVDPGRCHTGIYKRLHYNQPSIVIGNFRKNMLIHPTQQRGLSVREAARLQSFPDSFTLTGSIGLQQQLIGNSVPPLLAESVFAAILSHA